MDGIRKQFFVSAEARLQIDDLEAKPGTKLSDGRGDVGRDRARLDVVGAAAEHRARSAEENARMAGQVRVGGDEALVIGNKIGAVTPVVRLRIIRPQLNNDDIRAPIVAQFESVFIPVRKVTLAQQGSSAHAIITRLEI